MPRRPFITNPHVPYNIGARSNNKDWFALPKNTVWEIMSRYLFFVRHAFQIKIHLFVLMDNHYHMMATFPDGNLPEAMQYFMRETSRCIAAASGRINHVYGGRHYRCEIPSFHHFENVYKYIYRNPVEAGLCSRAEDYLYSTLHGLLGLDRILMPLEEDTLMFDGDICSHLSWLNSNPKAGYAEAMKKALKHSTLKFSLVNTDGLHPLFTERY